MSEPREEKARSEQVDPKLLELLVCPLTKCQLTYDPVAKELISPKARLAYPILDGVPMMTAEAARPLGAVDQNEPLGRDSAQARGAPNEIRIAHQHTPSVEHASSTDHRHLRPNAARASDAHGEQRRGGAAGHRAPASGGCRSASGISSL